MIELPHTGSLSAIERYGLDLLIDLSRLLPSPAGVFPDAVRIEITEQNATPESLPDWIAKNWLIQPGDGAILLPRATLRVLATIAGGVAEQKSTARDQHDRVPSSENALVSAALEKQAIVSRAAMRLRETAAQVAGRRPFRVIGPWPEGKRWAVALTHDLDLVKLWPLAVGYRLAELGRKGKLRLAVRAMVRSVGALGGDPVWKGVQSVLEPEAEFSAHSTWFIICETPTPATIRAGDVTYLPESREARRIIRDLVSRGCEVGLHGSFATMDGVGVFERQRERLGRISGNLPAGVRQHFLRMRPGQTQEKMRVAGFVYDSTWGFSDRNGFRLGVADILPGWNSASEREQGIEEAPFCWMDRALSKYRGVEDASAWVREGLELAAECRAVEGLWVGVWHPNMHPALGFPGATDAFETLISEMASNHPFFGSLGSLVRWRTVRRSLLARGVSPSGEVTAAAAVPSSFSFQLEDSAGHVLERIKPGTQK